MSQACYAESCTNPVIGQCLQGYKGSCGRFYCHQHQSNGLCGVCNGKKTLDREIEDIRLTQELRNKRYVKLVKKVNSEGIYFGSILYLFGFVALGLICILAMMLLDILGSLLDGDIMSNDKLPIVALISLIIFSYGYLLRHTGKKHMERRQKMIDKIAKDNPGFEKFYRRSPSAQKLPKHK